MQFMCLNLLFFRSQIATPRFGKKRFMFQCASYQLWMLTIQLSSTHLMMSITLFDKINSDLVDDCFSWNKLSLNIRKSTYRNQQIFSRNMFNLCHIQLSLLLLILIICNIVWEGTIGYLTINPKSYRTELQRLLLVPVFMDQVHKL